MAGVQDHLWFSGGGLRHRKSVRLPCSPPRHPATPWNEAATSPMSPSRGPSQVPRRGLPSITAPAWPPLPRTPHVLLTPFPLFIAASLRDVPKALKYVCAKRERINSLDKECTCWPKIHYHFCAVDLHVKENSTLTYVKSLYFLWIFEVRTCNAIRYHPCVGKGGV